MLIPSLLLIWAHCCISQSAPSPTLGWLVEEGGDFLQARISVSQIVEVNFKLDLQDEKISEAFAQINYVGEQWITLENVKASGLTDRLIVGLENFRLTSEYLQYTYSNRGTDKSHINSDCIFFVRVLDEKDLLACMRLRTVFDTLSSASKEDLEKFANTFDFVSNYWVQISEQSLYEVDSLRQGSFPLTFRGRIESSECLSDITYEEITVLNCESGEKYFACYVSYRYPIGINKYVRLEAVNHEGITLKGTRSNIIYAREIDGTALHKFRCTLDGKNSLPLSVPICEDMQEKECLEALLKNNMLEVTSYCLFEMMPARELFYLARSVLVEACGATVLLNNKPLYPPLTCPFSIESTQNLTVSSSGKEFLFPSLGKVDKIQVSSISTATVDKVKRLLYLEMLFSAQLGWVDILTFTIGTSLLLTLLIKGIVWCFCRNSKLHKKCNCRRCKLMHVSSIQNRTNRKQNYQQNKRLLTGGGRY